MCAVGQPSAGGQPQGSNCSSGNSETVSYMPLTECVWRGTVTAGGTSATFVFDHVVWGTVPAVPQTVTQQQTVGSQTVTFSVVFYAPGCVGSVN